MTQTTALLLDDLGAIADRPLSPLTAFAVRIVVGLIAWEQRRRTRMHLRDLPDNMLKDIGISRHAARKEAAKPFWMG